MPSLWKRDKSPFYYCCFTGPNGERLKKSTKQHQHALAWEVCNGFDRASRAAREASLTEAQARKVVSDIAERAGVGAIEIITVTAHLTDWLASKELIVAAGTFIRYKPVIIEFLLFIGKKAGLSIAAVQPRDIERFRDHQIKQGKAPGSANMAVKTLRIPFGLARKQGLTPTNPAELVDMLPTDRGERKTFTREQIAVLLANANEEWQGMILIGACHGLRLLDTAQLVWDNISFDRISLTIKPKKTARRTGKAEEYPLHPDVLEYLQSRKGRGRAKSIFPTLSNVRGNGRDGLSAQFRELMHKSGIYTAGEAEKRKKGLGRRFFELGYHSLRHTAISEQANQGVSKEIRMKLSGHKSQVHERYTHHELEALRVEIEKVPSFLKG